MEDKSDSFWTLDNSVLIDACADAKIAAFGIADTEGCLSSELALYKSAIICAFQYPVYKMEAAFSKMYGRIASFASGIDYHITVKKQLQTFLSHIPEIHKEDCAIHVDDIRIHERQLAVKAGIGWIGKNSCLFVPECGSFVVLGEILLKKPLKIRAIPLKPQCGNCEKCIMACPGGALSADKGFDREKCVSHLTQKKGLLPVDKMKCMGNWVYGCDVCQLVCPHNRGYSGSSQESSSNQIDLLELMIISNDHLRKIDPSRAYSWIGRNTLRRNAIIAAANMGYKDCRQVLVDLLTDNSEVVSVTAKHAIAHMFADLH